MNLTATFINKFNTLTKYNLPDFLGRYTQFIEAQYPLIVNYYNGLTTEINPAIFTNLTFLQREADSIVNSIISNRGAYTNFEDWDNLEFIEDIRTRLSTISKSHKYLRSSKRQGQFNSKMNYTQILQQGQTLEEFTRNSVDSNDFENEWVEIAFQNDISELDYDYEGGNQLTYTKSANTPSFKLESVIDTLQGLSLYGLDINRKITFKDNDLEILSYEDTFQQAVEILTGLSQGDIPDRPFVGIDRKFFIGNNLGALAYPTLIRQLNELFLIDDTIVDFRVISFDYLEGDLYISFEVTSFYNHVKTINAKI